MTFCNSLGVCDSGLVLALEVQVSRFRLVSVCVACFTVSLCFFQKTVYKVTQDWIRSLEKEEGQPIEVRECNDDGRW